MHGEALLLASATVGLVTGTIAALAGPPRRLRERLIALGRRFIE